MNTGKLRNPYANPWWLPDWEAIFGIDLRSLALFRILIAIILLYDVAVRAGDLQAMYDADGVASAEVARAWLGTKWRYSLFYLSDTAAVSGWLFMLATLLAAMLLVGFQSRIAVVGCWVMWLSIHYRAPAVNNGGDIMLRTMLFWAMFLPLGARWSVDALWWKRLPERTYFVSLGVIAILAQLCIVYWFTGQAKSNDHWTQGEAMDYVMRFADYGRPGRHLMLAIPWVLPLITWGTLALELGGPFMIWFPWFTRYIRIALVVVFVGFHLGIELTMTVGLFSWVSMAAWCLLLPDTFWNLRWLQFIGEKLSSPSPQHHSDAPRVMYPQTTSRWCFWLAFQVVCLFFLVYVAQSNISGLGDSKDRDDPYKKVLPRDSKWIGRLFGLSQNWNMFGSPPTYIGWYSAKATLKNGRKVDLLRGGNTFTDTPPDDYSGQFPNHRWRKMMRTLIPKTNKSPSASKMRIATAKFLADRWNATHSKEEQVVKVELRRFYNKVHLDKDELGRTLTKRFATYTAGYD